MSHYKPIGDALRTVMWIIGLAGGMGLLVALIIQALLP